MSRPRDARPGQDAGRGLDVRQLLPLGDHPRQGRGPDGRPGGAGRLDDRRRRRPRPRGAPAARRRLDDRRRRLRQPRPGVVHRQRPPPHGRGARGAAPEAGRRPSPRTRASRCCWSRAQEFGAVVLGPKGVRYLDQDRVEGEDPTTLFGPHTIMSLKREDAMEHAPDLLLISQYDAGLGEVAAFEELIGSHGGLGGPADRAVHPASGRVEARRAGTARRARRLSQHPRLAGIDRDPARAPGGGDRSASTAAPATPEPAAAAAQP